MKSIHAVLPTCFMALLLIGDGAQTSAEESPSKEYVDEIGGEELELDLEEEEEKLKQDEGSMYEFVYEEDEEEDHDNEEEQQEEDREEDDEEDVDVEGNSPSDKAYANKLIFSDTPDIGRKWRPGFRLMLFYGSFPAEEGDTAELGAFLNPAINLYMNFADILAVDVFWIGLPRISWGNGEIIDYHGIISLKSRPFHKSFLRSDLKAGGGLRLNLTRFHVADSLGQDIFPEELDRSIGPFVTSSLLLRTRHLFNFSGSWVFQRYEVDGDSRLSTAWYFMPGYRVYFDRQRTTSFALEYLTTNAMELPLRIFQVFVNLQYTGIPSPVFNPNKDWYSWLFWGGSFARRRFRVDLTLSHHISFTPPYIIASSLGWSF